MLHLDPSGFDLIFDIMQFLFNLQSIGVNRIDFAGEQIVFGLVGDERLNLLDSVIVLIQFQICLLEKEEIHGFVHGVDYRKGCPDWQERKQPGLRGTPFLSILSTMGRRTFPWVLFLIFLSLLIAPYLFADAQSNEQVQFNGFLQNPQDGYSYLAKIEQGMTGSWTFRLPFTSQMSEGKPLFLYYLFLGHQARIYGIGSIQVFHLSRMVNAIILFLTLWLTLPSLVAARRLTSTWMMTIVCLGGGLGWILLPTGIVPGDFWVAEAFPFLASFTNPHFPLAIACLLGMIWAWKEKSLPIRYGMMGLGAFLLAIIQPFGNVVLGLVLGMDWIWGLLKRKSTWKRDGIALVIFILTGLPYMIYSVWVVAGDSAFSNWNQQNITPGLTPLNWVFTFSPALILALIHLYQSRKQQLNQSRVFVIWMITAIVLSLLPVQWQRRFLIALVIPLSYLGFQLVDIWLEAKPKLGNLLRMAWVGLVLPSNLILIAIGILGVMRLEPLLFLYRDEIAGFAWLQENAGTADTILTGPDTGLYIPAFTNLGVVYGHPFETPDAAQRKAEVLGCLQAGDITSCEQVIAGQGVDFILVGPREKSAGWNAPSFDYPIAYQIGEVVIYEVVQ